MNLFPTLLILPFVFVSAQAKPQVLWVGGPARPGEAVQVYGAGFGTSTVVRAAGRPAWLLNAAEDGFAFALPAEAPAEGPIECEADGARFTLNAPAVWWAQGDRGNAATPGGWVRVFGTSLQRATARSLGFGDWVCTTQDCWSATFAVPPDAVPGAKLPHALALVSSESDWKTNVFDVTRYGAVPSDRHDDSAAIRAALADIEKAGGGILYFPRGRYGMQGTLALPPHSLLKGEGEDLVLLQWQDEDNPDYPLVTLTHHSGIEDIFLCSGNLYQGIITIPDRPDTDMPYTSEAITLNRVRVRFLHTDVEKEEGIRRYDQRPVKAYWDSGIINLQAKNLRVTDCDFCTSKRWNVFHADYGIIRGNRFTSVDCIYYQGNHLIVEGNDNRGCAASLTTDSRETYVGGNRFGENYGRIYGTLDRESFTFDRAETYFQGPAVCEGTRLRLTVSAGIEHEFGSFAGFQSKNSRVHSSHWIGQLVCIAEGAGRGQFREIKAIEGNDTIVIDRPWDVAPDKDSQFIVAWQHYHALVVNNTIDDGNPMQAYGSGIDVIFAGNRCRRNSGLMGYSGIAIGNSMNWFMQFIGNEIIDGMAIRGPNSQTIPAEDSGICLHTWDLLWNRPLSKAAYFCSFRGNRLDSNSRLCVRGKSARHILATGNVIRKNGVGIDFREPAIEQAAVWGNRFEEVPHPYRLNGNVVADRSELEQLDLADLLDLGIPDSAFAPLAAGMQTNGAAEVAFTYPAGLPPGELTLESITPPKGWTAKLSAPLKLQPGQRARAWLALSRPGAGSAVTFTLPAVWRLRAGKLDKTAAVEYRANQLCISRWRISPELAGNPDATVLEKWLGSADGKLAAVQAKDPFCGLKLEIKPGSAVYAQAVVTARRPIRVSLHCAAQSDRPGIFWNGRGLTSSGRHMAEPEITLRPGANVFEILKRYQVWSWIKPEDAPCYLAVTLTALEPTSPGDLRQEP